LCTRSKEYRRSGAIRYVPNARLFDLETSSPENFRAFIEFEALFVVLFEDDGHEYYLDGQNRLFKLDNASSFTVSENTINWFSGDVNTHTFLPDINAPLESARCNNYRLTLQLYKEMYGEVVVDAYLSLNASLVSMKIFWKMPIPHWISNIHAC